MPTPTPRTDATETQTSVRKLVTAASLTVGALALWFLSFDWTWLVLAAMSTTATVGLARRMRRERRPPEQTETVADWPPPWLEAELDDR